MCIYIYIERERDTYIYIYIHMYMYIYIYICIRGRDRIMEKSEFTLHSHGAYLYIFQGPPEHGRSCDYSEQVTIIAYYSL